MLGAFLSGCVRLVWGVLLQLVGRAGLLWRDGKVGFPSVLELSAYLSLVTNLFFRVLSLTVTAGLLMPEEKTNEDCALRQPRHTLWPPAGGLPHKSTGH